MLNLQNCLLHFYDFLQISVLSCIHCLNSRCASHCRIILYPGHNFVYISCVAITTHHLNACTITLLWNMHATHIFCNPNTTMHRETWILLGYIAMLYQVNYALLPSVASSYFCGLTCFCANYCLISADISAPLFLIIPPEGGFRQKF